MIDRSEWHRFMDVALVDGWYLHLRWIGRPRLDADVATAAAILMEETNAGVERPLLVEMGGQSELTRDARVIFMRCRTLQCIALLGSSAVDRVVANFSLGVGVTRPTAFFTERDDAITWMRTGELPADVPVAVPDGLPPAVPADVLDRGEPLGRPRDR